MTAPLFAQALTLTLADSSDVRARLERPEDEAQSVRFDAYTQPGVTLDLTARRTAYSLAYLPSFTALDLSQDPTYSVLHNVNASAITRFGHTSVSLIQTFTYGTENLRLSFLPTNNRVGDTGTAPEPTPDEPKPGAEPGAPPTLQPGQEATLNEGITFGAATTTLGLGHELSRRVSMAEFASYSYSTGLGDSAGRYPRQQGTSAGAALDYGLTKRDTLTSSLVGSVVYTDPLETSESRDVRRSIVAAAQERWTRTWIKDLEITLGVGATFSRTDQGEVVEQSLLIDVGPVGSMSIDYKWGSGGAKYTATAQVGSTPYVDRFTGIVDPRLFWSLSLERVRGRFTLLATVAGAQSTNADSVTPFSTANALVTANYEVTNSFLLRSGVSASSEVLLADEVLDQGTRPPPPLYYAFVGFTYRLQPLQF